MSSENPSSKDVKAAATDLGRDEFRKAYGAAGRGTTRAADRAPGLTDVASEGASGAADLAREVAAIVLRAAIGIGEQVVKAAGQLESAVGDEPGGGSEYEPHTDAAAPCEPAVLRLGSVSPGGSASKSFDVRNDSLDTMDAMRLRCDGLFAHAGARIPGKSIRFAPPTVDVAP